MTSTDAHGHYDFVFDSAANSYHRNLGVVGALFYAGGGDFENYVQAVPWGTADIVKNLHLRRARTVNAGQSFAISIGPDSSVAYDGEDWLRMDWLWEQFHVRVADAGILTIAARPDSGGMVPSVPVFCVHAADNCLYSNKPGANEPGTRSMAVGANSLFDVRLAIPSGAASQRYQVATSLERNAVPTLLER